MIKNERNVTLTLIKIDVLSIWPDTFLGFIRCNMLQQLSDLDLRLIRVFLSVLDAGGVSAAQTALNVSQSTISTQLATLETRLGFRLCERGRAGFRLTPRGEQFAQACRQLL